MTGHVGLDTYENGRWTRADKLRSETSEGMSVRHFLINVNIVPQKLKIIFLSFHFKYISLLVY